MELSRICVYCGSSAGTGPDFADAARSLGELLAHSGITLVYGGAAVGLMGAVADAALAAGGRVVGVIPRHLFSREVAHPGLTELVETGSMHERKQVMFELADAFVALPGGLGTLEELTEIAPGPSSACTASRSRPSTSAATGRASIRSCARRPPPAS